MRRKNVAMSLSQSSSASGPAQDVGSAEPKSEVGSDVFATISWIARVAAVNFAIAIWLFPGQSNPGIAIDHEKQTNDDANTTSKQSNAKKKTEMGRLVFGTNKHFDKTAANVLQAIRDGGYTHVVTCGRHANYNEEGSGIGIRQGVRRFPVEKICSCKRAMLPIPTPIMIKLGLQIRLPIQSRPV